MRCKNMLITGALIAGSTIHVFANAEDVVNNNMNKELMAVTARNINLMYKNEWEKYKNSSEYKLEIKRINLEKELGIKIEKLIPVT
ncbi:hypothetical protein QEW_0708 [Clostridioides difficile CD160]|nr:hypothetical protein QEW_0708 [Clostridioides difficile CD160]